MGEPRIRTLALLAALPLAALLPVSLLQDVEVLIPYDGYLEDWEEWVEERKNGYPEDSLCDTLLTDVLNGLGPAEVWYWAELPLGDFGGRYFPDTDEVYLDVHSYYSRNDNRPLVSSFSHRSHPLWPSLTRRIVHEAWHDGANDTTGNEDRARAAERCMGLIERGM